jgi:hypothetical protein
MPGTITISTLSDGTNSTSATNPILGSAKAWVNFNGTNTVAIRGSYNVSSVTDNGTGDYTVNFTNALPNVNYSFTGTHNGSTQNCNPTVTALGTASVTFYTSGGAGAGSGVQFFNFDPTQVSIAVFSA